MNRFIESIIPQMLEDIAELIKIPSISRASDESEYPFGKPVAEALQTLLKKADTMGFSTKNYENYVAEITIGNGEDIVGILCHVDVVDGGDGWSCDPFEIVIKDDEIYGRGIIDDKGPMISCLYAMRYIYEKRLLPENKQIKMIIGTDEEENWESIHYYLSCNPLLPRVSIVPDANFPVIYCEKGLINFELTKSDLSNYLNEYVCVENIKGGERANVVPLNASCTIASKQKEYNFEKEIRLLTEKCNRLGVEAQLAVEGDYLIFSVKGKAAHAMTPEKGNNAISYLMQALAVLKDEPSEKTSVVDFYNRYIGLDYNGQKLDCEYSDEESGMTTVNIGQADFVNGILHLTVNLRYPVSLTFNAISEKILSALEAENVDIKWGVCMDPVYFNKDSDTIQKLMKVYQNTTGDYESKPISLGGATYARAIPNAVAFGPVFPDQEELAHEADEHYSLLDLKRITEIYIKALLELCTN